MRRYLLTFLVSLSLLFSVAHADENKELGLRDGLLIFATGYGLRLGAIGTIELNENLAPLAAIAYLGAGYGMDLVGDQLGHNGSMGWTVVGTLAGTVIAAPIGFLAGYSDWENKVSEYLVTATILSLGPLLGTFSYHWSNRPQQKINAQLTPMILESPMQRQVQGLGISGTF